MHKQVALALFHLQAPVVRMARVTRRWAEFDLTRLCASLLRIAYSPDGFNIGMNLGRVAGAGVADHLHMHIVPRWSGDTNFMPVLADTHVLPQALDELYALLKKHL